MSAKDLIFGKLKRALKELPNSATPVEKLASLGVVLTHQASIAALLKSLQEMSAETNKELDEVIAKDPTLAAVAQVLKADVRAEELVLHEDSGSEHGDSDETQDNQAWADQQADK